MNPFVTLTISAICFGGTFVAAKVAVDTISPVTVAVARFAIAALLLWTWLRIRPASRVRLQRQDVPAILAMGATAVAGYNLLFLNALRLAPASDGSIIVPGLAPILTVALAGWVLRERIHGWMVAGLLIALAGLALVMAPSGNASSARLLGDTLYFAGAFCWAVYTVVGKQAMARLSPSAVTLYAMVAGTLMLAPFAIAERGWVQLAAAPLVSWIGLIYLATFGSVVAFVTYQEGIKQIGAGPASAFALVVPVFGVLSSVWLLNERLTAFTVIGGILTLLGLWLVERPVEEKIAPRAAIDQA